MSDDNKPIDGHKSSSKVGERVIDKPELPKGGIVTDQTVMCEMVAGNMHIKRSKFGKFEVMSDEGENIGGTDTAPTPMTYLAMATGF